MTLNPWRLRLLDVFERLGTVRAVANELTMSPSTVSQQLAVLESETGARLFDRVGRTLVLTPAGVLLVERARELRDHMDSIEAELADVTTGPVGRVRLGGFASSVPTILIPTVTLLAASHPRLEVELLEIEPRDAVTALHQGRCDLMVTVDEADGTLLAPSISTFPLATDPLLAVVPVGHPAAQLDRISLGDLADAPWALDYPGTYLGELVPARCHQAGFEPNVVGRFSSYQALLASVAAGLAVGVLPQLAVSPQEGVVARPINGMADRQIVAAVRSGNARRHTVELVLDALRSSAA